MYSYEQRGTAVKLLIQYDMSYSTVIQELGYPNNSKSLRYWYEEYESKGNLHKTYAGYECQPESDPRARLILSHLCSFESEPFKPRLLNGQADKSSRSCRVHMT